MVFKDIFRASYNTPRVATLKQPWSHMTQQHWTWKEGILNTLTVRNVAHRALLQGRSKVVGRHLGDALELAWLAAQHDSTWLARQLYSTGVSPVSDGSVRAKAPQRRSTVSAMRHADAAFKKKSRNLRLSR